MMKKNKLYTANRWNQPAFMGRNLFPNGGSTNPFGAGLTAPAISPYNSWMSSAQKAQAQYQAQNPQTMAANVQQLSNFASKENAVDNPFSFKDAFGKEGFKNGLKAGAGALVGGLAGTVGQIGGNLISGGLHSGAGSAISGIGSTIGSAVSTVNPLLGGAISIGSGLLGGMTNALIGTKVDQAKLDAANEGTAAYNNFQSNAGSFGDVTGPIAQANVEDAYSGGLFKKGWARDKNAALRRQREDARQWAFNSVANNINNLIDDQTSDALAHYAAFGGPIDTGDMGAINYGFMSDYLTQKKRENDMKSKMGGIVPMPAFMPNRYVIGGDLQTNGADWSTGAVTIGAGKSHELNPNEGVQVGVDNEGVPNLVEEGEVIFNDYVYSARIPIDQTTKEKFHQPKKRDISYAELAKKLEKEIAERPNDPISRSSFEKQMSDLAEQQERQKQEMEAERAKAAFEALSPEEQTALMQQRAEQEAMAQQAATREATAMQQPTEQVTPEEATIVQQEQMADGTQPNLGAEPQMNCFGGKINRFDEGGKKNSGKFKDKNADNWGTFTKPGLRRFIENIREQLALADTDEKKQAVRKQAMDAFNALQKSYADIYPGEADGKYSFSDAVQNHQKRFDNMYGNTGFYSTDEAGNVRNLIAEAIDMPKGHATDDKPNSWYDGYWGPRTSIRNFGSTEYGDDSYYKDLVDAFRELGLTYAPSEWKYGDNTLYGLSMAEAPASPETKSPWDTGERQSQVVTTPSPQSPAKEGAPGGTDTNGIDPRHRWGWLRYAGLLGPAVGLGMQAAGIGKPDTGIIDAAVQGAGNVDTARWKPLGNYLTYRPLDIWYAQNAMNAQSRATDRALMNASGANRGTAMAGLLANDYNSQLASGNLFRQAQEYNDALRQKIEDFNRGTDQYNSEQYGATSRFNADARNRARQANAQLRLHAAAQKADMDAGWNQGIYGNVTGLFKGIGDIGRENEQFNWLSDLAADGAFGNLGTSNTGRKWTKEKKSKGGKIKKRGLTI